MPLLQSASKKDIGTNIKTELGAGKSLAQSRAIALSEARKNGAQIPPPNRRRYQDGAKIGNSTGSGFKNPFKGGA